MRNVAKTSHTKRKSSAPSRAPAADHGRAKATRKGNDLYVYRSEERTVGRGGLRQGEKTWTKSAESSQFVQVRVDKSLLAQLNVEKSTELVGTVEDGALVIRPTRRISMTVANKLATEVMRKYDDALRKLAQ